ncbi:Isoquinoline 1-oxidoreductase, beta subunit [Beijerinckiaceae bacterium RH AL1]|nr:molybdopterin-dependent oxidoreductase [Beijerinckiaceae bacterium]VVB44549.1 Isoquinoline 1-oxidoreductase, beta subunit [Beijerinckiaceae bacterium RH CH11]VVB44628.1 Isoquinoline 1-oxidoreductase, beta subunit [Beijerinckiaceae bacterium RH AL8]VVC54414.1 Isoquinoline 1-oxidoreductase, beta subunit [Beijerinckiaceae bacterium RH AL1]
MAISDHIPDLKSPSRRTLLQASALAGGGLVIGLRLSGRAAADDAATFMPNAFVRIEPTGKIVLIAPHTEVGQGIDTAQAMLVGEELDVGLDQISVQPAPPDIKKYADPILGDQATGGSASVRGDWERLRKAGATARAMLVAAAAAKWQVDPQSCTVARGVVSHQASGRSLKYGEVASDAAKLPVPTDVKLKDPAQFKLLGTNAKRIDTPAKVNGTAVFGIDAKVDGMKIGTLALVPVVGGKLTGMDEAAARKVPGVRDVVRVGDEAVAVIGDHMWAAKQGLAALAPVWSAGPNGATTVAKIVADMDQASQSQGVVAKKEGDAAGAIGKAAKTLNAVYELPFLSHSPMEPLNCTLHIQPDKAEIWVGTQVPVRAQKAVADVTGLAPEKVTVNNLYMGGAFGRRLDIDSVEIAAKIAKGLGYPVKIVWTREEDLRHDYYRPYYYDRLSAGLDADGKLVGWTHRVTGSSVMARWFPGGFKDGLDPDAVEGAAETPYDVPATFVDYVRHESPNMNTGWWRGVGPTHNVFVVESFLDELAAAAGKDAVAFRRPLLDKNPRALAVLELAAQKSGWGSALPPRHGRGVALQFAFGSYVAAVVEVEVTPPGEILLRRADVAVDCGLTVNPDTVVAQIQGGLILGLSTAMYNEITLTGGAITQSNFHDYRAMRINEAPKIAVHQIRNGEKPGGIGETGTSIAAPALGNAIYAATGQRLRKLPFATGLRGA